MRRVLFLDVNGVLNSQRDYGMDGLGESHLRHLKRIVDESGCEIVLISSWRSAGNLREQLRRAFNQFSIPIWIDVTPELFDRAEEILAWLGKNERCNGVIVDDDCDGFGITGLRFVQTSLAQGLTFELSSEIIEAFENQ
jgi:hypothetical protein